MPDLLRRTTPIARTYHHCSWCGLSIRPGEEYRHVVMRDEDGDLYTWRAHPVCQHLADTYIYARRYLDDTLTSMGWWDDFTEDGEDGLRRLVRGSFSWDHPQVQRLRQLLLEGDLPLRPSAYRASAQRCREWLPSRRGELQRVEVRP